MAPKSNGRIRGSLGLKLSKTNLVKGTTSSQIQIRKYSQHCLTLFYVVVDLISVDPNFSAQTHIAPSTHTTTENNSVFSFYS